MVAAAMEPNQVRPQFAAAVESEFTDALRQLGHHQEIVIELVRLEREIGVLALLVDREQASEHARVLGDLRERLPRDVFLAGVGFGTAGITTRGCGRGLNDADRTTRGQNRNCQDREETIHESHGGTPDKKEEGGWSPSARRRQGEGRALT